MRSRCLDDLPPENRAIRGPVKFVFGEEDEHEEALYGTAIIGFLKEADVYKTHRSRSAQGS
jgi:hypothetical protein